MFSVHCGSWKEGLAFGWATTSGVLNISEIYIFLTMSDLGLFHRKSTANPEISKNHANILMEQQVLGLIISIIWCVSD